MTLSEEAIRRDCINGTQKMAEILSNTLEAQVARLERELTEQKNLNETLQAKLEHVCSSAQGLRPIDIGVEVAKKHGIPFKDMRSKRRYRHLVYARQEWMWRLKKETPLSLPSIARIIGKLDHTTVLWGVRQHEKRITRAVCPSGAGLADDGSRPSMQSGASVVSSAADALTGRASLNASGAGTYVEPLKAAPLPNVRTAGGHCT